MIDGVKIQIPTATAEHWLNNTKLHFQGLTELQTGEMVGGSVVAKYKGLKFFICYSAETGNITHCEISGSLHKYFNNGKHNANDFNINDLATVLNDLNKVFSVDSTTAILRNLEFGVNVLTPLKSSELLKNLVAYKNYEFGTLKVERKTVGKQIEQQRQKLKIYDKGKQYKLKDKNLTRFEVAIKKMESLKPYNIKTLADLTEISKITPLLDVLLRSF